MRERIERLADWYVKEQLNFDRVLISYRYQTIREYFKKGIGLEMGSGDGVMTAFLKDDFEELDVVEGSMKLLETIPNYPNVRKHCSLFEHFEPSRQYDTIIMEHILEHLEKPVEVLARTRLWLKPEGVVIIGVPNAKSFHRLAAVKMGLLESEYQLNERDKALGHYRVYDWDSIKKDVESAGYKVRHIGGIFFKPLSNKQIEETWTPEMIEGFYQLGKDFQENAAEIFVVATLT
ncbi:MAG: class I SAM-dependent methyltransferase [Chloroherpetonaceae bacterium]|nr:class I SAM-dependent methyltransferase [Chloroherpetonaceae bacterium]